MTSDQVFIETEYAFAFVNIRPVIPGHVLVCPLRVVHRFKDLTTEEVYHLFFCG